MSGQATPVQYSEAALPSSLTEAEKEAVRERILALQKVLNTEKKRKAKYKIEILFGRKRSIFNPTAGVMSFWESGSKLHGGGDSKIYFCPGKSIGKNECEAYIMDSAHGLSFLVCTACGSKWHPDNVHGEIMANLPMKKWAAIILKHFVALGHDCDIYLKHAPDDIRSASASEQEKQQHGDKLNASRAKRALSIYPLANIIRDTAAGADLLQRFYAFLAS